MFAVFKTGGKQYRVAADDKLQIGKINQKDVHDVIANAHDSCPRGRIASGDPLPYRYPPCAGGESVTGQGAPPLLGLGGVGQPGEHRAAEPSGQEGVDVTRGLQGGRRGLVRLAPPVPTLSP